MFTGIVEETGRIVKLDRTVGKIRLELEFRTCTSGLKIGDSLATNGCCLTVVGKRRMASGRHRAKFDLLEETWERTSFRQLKVGSAVNLERALAANGRLGGHFVTGHVDGMGTIRRWEEVGGDHLLEIKAPADIMRYVIPKGSIAVDGISLTVAKVVRGGFQLCIIPHTIAVTNLSERNVGDVVNLEADMIGKYVAKLII